MTDFVAPRNGQDGNSVFATSHPHLAMSQYPSGNGLNYVYNDGSIHYPTVNTSYSSYSTPYATGQNGTSSAVYLPGSSSMALQYLEAPARVPTLPSQPRALSHAPYHNHLPTQRMPFHQTRVPYAHDPCNLPETESQESFNEGTMMSEPVIPVLDGYPDVKEFDELMKCYVQDLSPKKQDKALIHARRAANIKTVLIDKKTTSVESAQFRFWVKKMFQLLPNDPKLLDRQKKICHEGKPVAVREKLFKILTRAHKQCQHGGRDKTSAQVRKIYSWVPKELISRFVKLCPTCQVRRGTARVSPPSSERSPTDYMDTQSPEDISPQQSRRQSVASSRGSISVHSPMSMAGFSQAFQSQNRWMTPVHQNHRPPGIPPTSAGCTATSSFNSISSSAPMVGAVNPFATTTSHHMSGTMNYVDNLHTLPSSSGYTSNGLRAVNGHLSPINTYHHHSIKEEGQY